MELVCALLVALRVLKVCEGEVGIRLNDANQCGPRTVVPRELVDSPHFLQRQHVLAMVIVTIDPVRGTVELLHALEAPHLSVVVVCTRVSAGMILEAALLMGLTLREREGGPDVISRQQCEPN